MDAVNEYLKRTRSYEMVQGFHYERPRPRIVCRDGFSVSVQAGEYLYCRPHINGADKYDSVELGFPNREEPLLMDYAEDPSEPTETVYGYVPIELVNKIIENHGGIIN